MTPKTAAQTLRLIADKIDASSQPSKQLVAKELRRLVAAIATDRRAILRQAAMFLAGTGFMDAQTIVETLKKAIEAGKLSEEQKKNAIELLKSLEEDDQAAAVNA